MIEVPKPQVHIAATVANGGVAVAMWTLPQVNDVLRAIMTIVTIISSVVVAAVAIGRYRIEKKESDARKKKPRRHRAS